MYYIYFIRQGEDGPIKIGHAKHPADRIKSLQIGNPNELQLIGAIPGFVKDEITLHKKLAKYQIRGEWFHPSQEVLDEVNKADGVKCLKSLDNAELS